MSAEFVQVQHAGGGGTPGGKKAGFAKYAKSPVFLVVGGLIIVAFILLRSRQTKNTSDVAGTDINYPNPQASADSAAQLQNYQSMMDTEIAQAMSQYSQDVSSQLSDITQAVTDMGKQSQDYTNQVKDAILNQMQNKNDSPVYSQPTETATAGPSVLDELSALEITINNTSKALGKNFNDKNPTRNYLHQKKIEIATKAGYSVDDSGHVFDKNGNQVNIGQQA